MNTIVNEQARFDTRLPRKQKQFFEQAALLGGYRNLTDFIIQAVQEKAQEIVEEHERVIVSERDSEVFFNALTQSKKPNKSLRQAVEAYKSKFPK